MSGTHKTPTSEDQAGQLIAMIFIWGLVSLVSLWIFFSIGLVILGIYYGSWWALLIPAHWLLAIPLERLSR